MASTEDKLAADYNPKASKTDPADDPMNGYFRNISRKDQAILGPDRSRIAQKGVVVHISQAQTPGILEKAKGDFVKIRGKGLEALKEQAKKRAVLIIGGPLNNAVGSYMPIERAS